MGRSSSSSPCCGFTVSSCSSEQQEDRSDDQSFFFPFFFSSAISQLARFVPASSKKIAEAIKASSSSPQKVNPCAIAIYNQQRTSLSQQIAAREKLPPPQNQTSIYISEELVVPKKVYVVFEGRRQGIYMTWPECQANVNGFLGNAYRGYDSMEEAVSQYNDYIRMRTSVHGIRQDVDQDVQVLHVPHPGIEESRFQSENSIRMRTTDHGVHQDVVGQDVQGFILFSIKAQPLQLKLAKCNMVAGGASCEEANGFKPFIFCLGLYLGLKPIMISHGADQSREDDHKQSKKLSSYFNTAYFCFCFGALIALIMLIWVQTHSVMGVEFGVSATAMAMGLKTIITGTYTDRNQLTEGSIFTPLAQLWSKKYQFFVCYLP